MTLHARGIRRRRSSNGRRTCSRSASASTCCRTRSANSMSSVLATRWQQAAVAPTSISYYDTDGELLFREPRGIDGGYGYPQYSVHRGQLQMLLAVRAARTPGPRRCSHGRRGVAASTESEDRMSGAHGGGRLHGGRARRRRRHPFGGACAAASRTRSAAVVGRANVSGRGSTGSFLDGRTMVIVKDPDGVDLVTYPIGGGLINWVVMMPEADPGPLPGDAKWNQPGDRSEVLEHLERWRSGLPGRRRSGAPHRDRAASTRWSTARCCRGGDTDG